MITQGPSGLALSASGPLHLMVLLEFLFPRSCHGCVFITQVSDSNMYGQDFFPRHTNKSVLLITLFPSANFPHSTHQHLTQFTYLVDVLIVCCVPLEYKLLQSRTAGSQIMFHHSIDDRPRKLPLVYASQPVVKLVWLYVILLKVTETVKMISENLLYMFVESWNRLWCLNWC